MAVSIVSNFGSKHAGSALSEIGGDDPAFLQAGALFMQTGETKAARMMLAGRKMLADGTGVKVDRKVVSAVRAVVAQAIPSGAPENVAGVMTAAVQHLAASGGKLDPEADPKVWREQLNQSVFAVTGGKNEIIYDEIGRGTRVELGGMQKVRGLPTMLPSNMSAAMVEHAITTATGDNWKAASVSGRPPVWGRQALSEYLDGRDGEENNKMLRIQAIGGGMYLLGIARANGQLRWLTDETMPGGYYLMKLPDLLKSMAAN